MASLYTTNVLPPPLLATILKPPDSASTAASSKAEDESNDFLTTFKETIERKVNEAKAGGKANKECEIQWHNSLLDLEDIF